VRAARGSHRGPPRHRSCVPEAPRLIPTLLVIADDLFISLNPPPGDLPKSLDYYNPRFALYSESGYFQSRSDERLRGVGTLNEYWPGEFSCGVFSNPLALVTLPLAVLDKYRQKRQWAEMEA
jgi:hypothetical protein